jgi:hypothetical protein
MKVKPNAMVRTLRTLALKVQFGVQEQVKLVPLLLKCFPCLETLYIKVLIPSHFTILAILFLSVFAHFEFIGSLA